MKTRTYTIHGFQPKLVKEKKTIWKVESCDTGEYPRIGGTENIVPIAEKLIGAQQTESILVFWLSGQNELVGYSEVSRGGLHGAAITPRDVFIGAIVRGVSAIILCHNHPSGNSYPSPDDIEMTKNVIKAGKLLGIIVLDHVIVTNGRGYTSLANFINF